MEENLIKRFMTSIKCNVCGQHYDVDNVKVLGHQEDLWFLNVFCSACQTQCLVAAVVKEGRKPKVITDLTEAELARFEKLDKLTADEVLDMHSFLKNFDGDFSKIFNQK
ncbi:hypothetical protein ACFLX8_00520 [Chloroflexota bacterium]